MEEDQDERIGLGKRLKWVAVVLAVFAAGIYWENTSWDRDDWEATSRREHNQEVEECRQEVIDLKEMIAGFDQQILELQMGSGAKLMKQAGATNTEVDSVLSQQLSNCYQHRSDLLELLGEAERRLQSAVSRRASIRELWRE